MKAPRWLRASQPVSSREGTIAAGVGPDNAVVVLVGVPEGDGVQVECRVNGMSHPDAAELLHRYADHLATVPTPDDCPACKAGYPCGGPS